MPNGRQKTAKRVSRREGVEVGEGGNASVVIVIYTFEVNNNGFVAGGGKPSEASSTSSSWFSYGTAMVANIVENIQLDIRDIHVRYEGNLHVRFCV